MEKFYAVGAFKPKVTIDNDWVYVDIDIPAIESQYKDYQQVVDLCSKGAYAKAKPLLLQLIQKNPSNSEYHRIMGQMLSDEGDQEEAINYLIDALRWDSKNSFALLMMGNIYSKYQNDIETALLYYNQALAVKPDDFITLVNIGINIFQAGKKAEALKFVNQAIAVNPEYPNAFMALAIIAERENNWQTAFEKSMQTLKLCKQKDTIYKNALQLLVSSAEKLIATTSVTSTINQYKGQLESVCDKNILIKENQNLATAAKIEFAEYYNRSEHIVYFKPEYKAHEHLIMHELVHLDFVLEARKNNANKLFTTNSESRQIFFNKFKPQLVKKLPAHIPPDNVNNLINSLFDGLNSRIYNAPIDLFIEDFLFEKFEALRPYQLVSQMKLIEESIHAVTNKDVLAIVPQPIVSATKVYNYVMALQFKDMFGIDILEQYNASHSEKTQAHDLYEEYLEYKDNKEPAEEYELVQNWAEDLKLADYFRLADEAPQNTSSAEDILKAIEEDPFDVASEDPEKEKLMQDFLENNTDANLNMAVVMYMADALSVFEKMQKTKIKDLAFELAMMGTQGINPDKKDYIISSMPHKIFSGYHVLAYYYVSWALAIPEMLKETQLPFDKEFELAKKFHQKNQ